MNLLSGVGAASALFKNATTLVQAIKQPKVTDEAFADLLKARIETASTPEARRAQAANASQEFLKLRDVNGDGILQFQESGLERAIFDRIDRNRDGAVSGEEYQQALLGEAGGEST